MQHHPDLKFRQHFPAAGVICLIPFLADPPLLPARPV
jgi:hypothetical protein